MLQGTCSNILVRDTRKQGKPKGIAIQVTEAYNSVPKYLIGTLSCTLFPGVRFKVLKRNTR